MSTPSTPGWHLDEALASGYASGRVGPILAASVEQHLVSCAPCRALLEPAVDPGRLEGVWAEVLERVETPRKNLLERALSRVGVDEPTARLVAVTPSLRGAWLTGVTIVLALALATAYADPHGIALFLALAPVLPVAGVAFAFGPAADPAHEIAAAAPYAQLRLLAVRTAFVVASTLLPAAVAGLSLPGEPWVAVAWLLPALSLTIGTLALSTRFAPHLAAVGLGVAWVALVLPGLRQDGNPVLAAEPPVQLTCLLAVAAFASVLLHRRHDLPELLRRTA